MIKSRRLDWAEYAVHMGDKRSQHIVLVEDMKKTDHLEDIGIDRRIILKLIIKNWDEWVCTGFIPIKIGTSGGLL
jgi:hypothetical protein